MPTIKLLAPLKRFYITQRFAQNPKMYAMYGMKGHNGLDFRTRWPETPLAHCHTFPMLAGKVIEIGNQGRAGYGKFVRLLHADGSQTIYAHLEKVYVKLGQLVTTATIMALTDNTGKSTGSHLHVGYRPPNWKALYNNGFKGYVDFYSMLVTRK